MPRDIVLLGWSGRGQGHASADPTEAVWISPDFHRRSAARTSHRRYGARVRLPRLHAARRAGARRFDHQDGRRRAAGRWLGPFRRLSAHRRASAGARCAVWKRADAACPAPSSSIFRARCSKSGYSAAGPIRAQGASITRDSVRPRLRASATMTADELVQRDDDKPANDREASRRCSKRKRCRWSNIIASRWSSRDDRRNAAVPSKSRPHIRARHRLRSTRIRW